MNTEHVRTLAEGTIRRAERAQQIAHDPTRWQEVCGTLAEVRMLLGRMLDEIAPNRHDTIPETVRKTPSLFKECNR